MPEISYCEAILSGFHYLLTHYPNVFLMGQGLWSPWYVGKSMDDLDKEFGQQRVIDSPVSELSTTGMAIGASLCGYRPVIIHPRMDFMILATDQIVNQAAKWCHMFGGQAHAPVTIRGIVNRGGEQGAQHSQALHAWFAHVPGLRVVMPATPRDARDLLIASVLCDDPVLFLDDRWLYEVTDTLPPVSEICLTEQGPQVLRDGGDVTLVGCSHTTQLCLQAAAVLAQDGIECEVIDLRVINPLRHEIIAESVRKTGRLIAVDGGWTTCGIAGEVLAGTCERVAPAVWRAAPRRITLPNAPAPTSKPLEAAYYLQPAQIVEAAHALLGPRVPTIC